MRQSCVSLGVLLALLLCVPAFAQQDRGTFTGTVTDPTGSVVPNVAITVQNMETNVAYTSKTNEVGSYTVPNLPIGRYRITFEAAGFKKFVRDGLTLNIAQVIRIDAPLQVGAAAETVEVTAEAPLLQTETPEVGSSLNTRQVIDMPLGFGGGRYAENFAYKLTPGVGGDNWDEPHQRRAFVLERSRAGWRFGHHLHQRTASANPARPWRRSKSSRSRPAA